MKLGEELVCCGCHALLAWTQLLVHPSGAYLCPHCGSPEIDWSLRPGAPRPNRKVDLGFFEQQLT